MPHIFVVNREWKWYNYFQVGDRDSICAIVGGMVSLYAEDIMSQWLSYMERPEDSRFLNLERRRKNENPCNRRHQIFWHTHGK